jgi:predicted O-methyltransferase YrrM
VRDRVEVVHGDAANVRAALAGGDSRRNEERRFGLLFVDHAKERYLPDLERLLAAGLLAPGCVVVADNVYFQGEPHAEYLHFVRQPAADGGAFAASEFHAAHIEYACAEDDPDDPNVPLELRDGVEVSQLGCDGSRAPQVQPTAVSSTVHEQVSGGTLGGSVMF